ncbi:unnamed protein product [Dicrocoelium dendriticum]|nr:unnamed protein product [Dicrocoelium dendriticum]
MAVPEPTTRGGGDPEDPTPWVPPPGGPLRGDTTLAPTTQRGGVNLGGDNFVWGGGGWPPVSSTNKDPPPPPKGGKKPINQSDSEKLCYGPKSPICRKRPHPPIPMLRGPGQPHTNPHNSNQDGGGPSPKVRPYSGQQDPQLNFKLGVKIPWGQHPPPSLAPPPFTGGSSPLNRPCMYPLRNKKVGAGGKTGTGNENALGRDNIPPPPLKGVAPAPPLGVPKPGFPPFVPDKPEKGVTLPALNYQPPRAQLKKWHPTLVTPPYKILLEVSPKTGQNPPPKPEGGLFLPRPRFPNPSIFHGKPHSHGPGKAPSFMARAPPHPKDAPFTGFAVPPISPWQHKYARTSESSDRGDEWLESVYVASCQSFSSGL